MRSIVSLLAVVLLFSVAAVSAKDLSEATSELCEKVKTCGYEQLAGQDVPPQVKATMEAMLDGMCESMIQPYVVATEEAGLEKMALACLESVNSQSCQELMEGDSPETPECKEFEAAAEKAYPDGVPGQ